MNNEYMKTAERIMKKLRAKDPDFWKIDMSQYEKYEYVNGELKCQN
jgi:hypothetical protein